MKMLTLLGVFIFSISAHAINGRTTYQARIVKPDGYPLEASSVNFRFTVLDPTGSCVMYVEDYGAVNMTSSGGLISFALGTGTVSFPASSTATTFSTTFDNAVTSFSCQSPGIYNPTPTDNRKIVMQFNDGNGWQTLPSMAINAVPYAMYAAKSQDSQKLNGKADTAFVQKASDIPTCAAGKMLYFNNASFSCVDVPAVGTSINSVSASGSALSITGTASDPVVTMSAASMSQDGYLTSLDYAEFKAKLAASSTQIVNTLGYAPVSGAAVTAQINNSNLSGDVSGTITSNFIQTVGGKTAAQISTSVDDTLAATASNTASTIVKRNSSGNATFNDVYANSTKINYVDIYKPSSSFNIRLQASTSLSANYTLTLPTTSGTTGQVLSTDGSGNLSWIDASTGSVVSVSATAPLASTGGSTPTISITQATSSTDGYLSSTDWNTFNNKQAATSAAIIATLGYTPADNAASGTYAQKANNLSDLTSSATARTNLGLGTFATASAIDLGSASATGTLAIARLPSFIGDATIATASNTIILSNSGVTAGTYTKVSVDAKGRVTSSSALSSSDVTTALGYTPANSTSGVTSLNGSTSQTQTFATSDTGTAFGISTENGVHTFAIPQAASSSVTAGLLSNADYTTFTNKQNATSSAIIATLGYTPANATSATQWTTNGSSIYYNTGNIGVGIVNPSAKLELASGTASIAPLKLTSGTLLSSAQSGTMEYDGFNFYLTDSTNTRRAIATGSNANTIDNVSTINSSGNISMVPVGAVIVSSTTASTNSNTGALVVKGGLGVAGNINTAGNLNVSGSQVIDGSLKLTSMTSGSVLFAGASGTVTQDNSNFFWDGANKRLGIGSNSPAQTLSVSGTGYFSGNVGMGTMTPAYKLSMYDGAGSVVHNIESGNNGSAAYTRTAGKTDAGVSQVYGSGLNITNGSGGYEIYDFTAGASRIYVSSTGNIGIGTTNPGALLQIGENTVSSSAFRFSPSSDQSSLRFTTNAVANWIQSGVDFSTDSKKDLKFSSINGATTWMTIQASSGNVGIGTSSPQKKLHINNSGLLIDGGSVVDGASYTTRFIVDTGSSTGHVLADLKNNNGSVLYVGGSNVGIGTSTPASPLEVNGDITATGGPGALNLKADVNDHTYIQFFARSATPGTRSGYFGYPSSGTIHMNLFNEISSGSLVFGTSGTERLRIDGSGNIGVGYSAPTAKLQLAAGTSSLAPLKFTSGTLLSSPQSGTMEYDGFNFYLTDSGGTRRTIATGSGSGSIDNASVINSSGNMSLVPVGSVIVSSTTASTDSQTGALVVNGGLGVAGNIYSSGTIVTSSNIQGSSITATSGMISPYIAGSIVSGGSLTLDSTTHTNKGNILLAVNGGNVGIGTATPLTTLHVYSNQPAAAAHPDRAGLILESEGTSVGGRMAARVYSDTENPLFVGYRARGSKAVPTALLSGDLVTAISPVGYDGSGWQTGAHIRFQTTENWNTGAIGSAISFRTPTNSSTTVLERMRIDHNGNVGIGTSAPMSLLHLSQNSAQLRVETSSTSTTGNAPIYLVNQDTTANNVLDIYFATRDNGLEPDNGAIIRSVFTNRSASGVTADLAFLTANDAENPIERMRLNSSGYLGIGTTSPSANLEVKTNTIDTSTAALRLTSTDGSFTAGQELQMDFNQNTNVISRIAMTYFNPDWGMNFYGYSGALVSAPIMTMRGNGNVGIGATAPRQKLDVNGVQEAASGTTPRGSFVVGGATTAGVLNMGVHNPGTFYSWIQSRHESSAAYYNLSLNPEGGNVGIGTTTPNRKLEVWGSASVAAFNTSASDHGYIEFYAEAANPTSRSAYIGYPSAGSKVLNIYSQYASGSVQLQNTAGSLILANTGNVGIASATPGSRLVVKGSGTTSATSAFSVTDSSNNSKFYVRDDGNVGIGTTNPGSKLTISSSIGSFEDVDGGAELHVGTQVVAAGTAGEKARLAIQPYGHTGGPFNFVARDDSSSAYLDIRYGALTKPSLFSLHHSGNLGIGTTSPSAKLEVTGNVGIGDGVAGNSRSGNAYLTISTSATANRRAGIQFKQNNTNTFELGVDSSIDNTNNFYIWDSVSATTRFVINASGNVGIGTTAPSAKLDVSGTINIASGSALAFGGTSVCTAAGCTSSSDERLKENIKPLDFDLNKLLSLNAVEYDWKNKAKYGDKHQIGFIAQNLEQVYPEVVYTDKNTGLKSVTYGHLVAPIIEALKSLYKRILGHDERLDGQDRQIASIVESKADKAQTDAKIQQLEAKAAKVDKLESENAELKMRLDKIEKALNTK